MKKSSRTHTSRCVYFIAIHKKAYENKWKIIKRSSKRNIPNNKTQIKLIFEVFEFDELVLIHTWFICFKFSKTDWRFIGISLSVYDLTEHFLVIYYNLSTTFDSYRNHSKSNVCLKNYQRKKKSTIKETQQRCRLHVFWRFLKFD